MKKRFIYVVTILAIVLASLSLFDTAIKAQQALNSENNILLYGNVNLLTKNTPFFWWDYANSVLNVGGAMNGGAVGSIKLNGSTSGSSTLSVNSTGALSFNGASITGQVQPVIPTAATIAPTLAQCGSLILFGATTGTVVTLPAPTAASGGCSYDLVITVTNTSNSNEIRTNAGTVFLLGSVEHSATGIAPLNFWADGTSIQALKMDGAHLGGLIGSQFHVVNISTTQWEISGTNECTSVCTTGFNATP